MIRLLVVLFAGGALSGCIAANGFGTARIVPPGRVEILAAPAVYAQSDAEGGAVGGGATAGVRVGALEGVDVGVQASVLQVRVEPRIRLLHGRHLALAVAPAGWVGSLLLESADDLVTALGAGATLIATWQPLPALAVTVLGGPEVAVLTDDDTTGLLTRQGGGIRWWVTPTFALHPELVVVTDAERGFAFVDLSGGVGLVFAPGRASFAR